MQFHTFSRLGGIPAIASLALVLGAHTAKAQNARPLDPNTPPVMTASPAPGNPHDPQQLITLDFKGGTLNDFIEAVRTAAQPTPFNIIVPADAPEIRIPAMALKDVTIRNAVRSLRYAAATDEIGIDAGPVAEEMGSAPVYAVQVARNQFAQSGGASRPLQSGKEMAVFSIEEIVEAPAQVAGRPQVSVPVERVLSALEMASKMEVDRGGVAPEIMLHEDSNVLIVRGTDDQLRTAKEILNQFRGSVERRRDEAKEAAEEAARAREEVSQLEARAQQAEANMQAYSEALKGAEERLDRAKALVDAGTISTEELSEARTAVANSQAALNVARIDFEMLQNMLSQRRAAEESAQAEPPDARLTIYDIKDLTSAEKQIGSVLDALRAMGGGDLPRLREFDAAAAAAEAGMKDVDPAKVLIVIATPEQHTVIEACLSAVRGAARGSKAK